MKTHFLTLFSFPRFPKPLMLFLVLAVVVAFLGAATGPLPMVRSGEDEEVKPYLASNLPHFSNNHLNVACDISGITVSNISACNDNGTNSGEDDYFFADVTVDYSNKPSGGSLVIAGRGSDSRPVSQIGNSTFTFQSVKMNAGGEPEQIYLSAYFSFTPTCFITKKNAGIAPKQCSNAEPLCPVSGANNDDYPLCWAPEDPAIIAIDECDNSLNYAPDYSNPELTPIKYVRIVLHIMQREDPNQIGQYKPHPTDPGNWSEANMAAIQSWFDQTTFGNVNYFLGHLCADLNDGSPEMTDARIRLLNYGIKDYDVFFHYDDRGWGESYDDCLGQSNTGWALVRLQELYLTGTYNPPQPNIPNPNNDNWKVGLPQSYKTLIQSPDLKNAYHVFITGGSWHDASPENGYYSATDGDLFCNDRLGGYTDNNSLGCNGSSPPSQVASLHSGSFPVLGGGPTEVIGKHFIGELYHILGVDHIGPLRSHKRHVNFADGCEDTDWESDQNVLGCNTSGTSTTKCAITQCQLGKMHYLLENGNPTFVRFPDGNGGFTMDGNCALTDPDIVIHSGQNVIWNSRRQIRCNVLVEPHATLTITCDVGLPENARITVKATGRLNIIGARLYNNCNGDYWDGIVVEGNSGQSQQVNLSTSPPSYSQGFLSITDGNIEGANTAVSCQTSSGTSQTGGIVQAIRTTFKNCQTRFVHIRDFQNTSLSNGLPTGNASYFSSCDFNIDGDYSGSFSGNFQEMVLLKNVDGVRFIGCNFTNAIPSGETPYQNDRRFGINASSAGFSVTGKCNGNTLPCTSYTNSTFTGFNRGIIVENYVGLKAFTVSNTDFTDNIVGIEAVSAKNAYVVSNNFHVGCNLPFWVPTPINTKVFKACIGLSLYSCTGYKVEKNNADKFNGAGTLNPVGIFVKSSGDQPNEVYGNNLSGLDFGNLSNGNNRHPDPTIFQGLQYLCNNNVSNTKNDFAVPSENGALGFGIRGRQGSSTLSAGNTFTSISAVPSNTELHFLNKQNSIIYFCPPCPTYYTVGKVTPVFANSNGCPSKLPGWKDNGKLDQTERNIFRQDFNNSLSSYETKAYAADMLVRDFLLDTIGINYDSIRSILIQRGDLYSRFDVVDTWLQQRNPTAAQQALSAIPSQYSLSGESQVEYNHFNTLKSIQISAIQNELTDEAMVANNLTTLTQLADAGNYKASVQAQALINSVNGYIYSPNVVLPTPDEVALKLPSTSGIDILSDVAMLDAQPNPAREMTTFRYRLPKGAGVGSIIVTDIDGRILAKLDVTSESPSLDWDIKGLKEGFYTYNLVIDGKTLVAKRLVIVR